MVGSRLEGSGKHQQSAVRFGPTWQLTLLCALERGVCTKSSSLGLQPVDSFQERSQQCQVGPSSRVGRMARERKGPEEPNQINQVQVFNLKNGTATFEEVRCSFGKKKMEEGLKDFPSLFCVLLLLLQIFILLRCDNKILPIQTGQVTGVFNSSVSTSHNDP